VKRGGRGLLQDTISVTCTYWGKPKKYQPV